MSRWQIDKPSPGRKACRRSVRPAKKVHRCNCGQPAVAKAVVRVGLDITHLVTLYLCKTCLAYELDARDVPPPISITYLT